MRFQIFSGETVIGTSNLDRLDSSMGIALGNFLPSENYRSVQSVFRLYSEAVFGRFDVDQEMLARYYRERDSLNLTVHLLSGETVPMQSVHIEDYSIELGEIEITIMVPDWQTFEQYFEPSE